MTKKKEEVPEPSLAEKAWDAVKGNDDAAFAACPPHFRNELEDRADAVVKTGIVNTSFEEKVAELSAKKKA